VQATDTATNQYGTPTVTTTDDHPIDSGTLIANWTFGDVETLAAGGVDMGDVINFDNSYNEQDSPSDNLSIGVTTNGQIGVGDILDSTETLNIIETPLTPSMDMYDDPGIENIEPQGSNPLDISGTESDTSTENWSNNEKLQIRDTVNATERKTLPDGTVITNTINDDDRDGVTDQETHQDVNADAEAFDLEGFTQPPHRRRELRRPGETDGRLFSE
jgi:hypothetical protein